MSGSTEAAGNHGGGGCAVMRPRPLRRMILTALAVAAIPLMGGEAACEGTGGIISSKHNLSKSGTGLFRAESEVRVCIFCHTPHHARENTPLWSHQESAVPRYDIYSSTTRAAKPGQPTGASRLCLSCHDGTIAVGALINNVTIPMVGGFTTIPIDRPTNLGGPGGTDLTNDHPFSFEYSANLLDKNQQLRLPSQISPKLRLDADQNLQCTTCHDPHNDQYGKFLVMDNARSAICTECHLMTGWVSSEHESNGATAVKGCGNCHVPHNARIPQRLMKETPEEQNCLPCHSGGAKSIQTLVTRPYAHLVTGYFGVHDTAESPFTAQKHVECEDCHNPHMAKISAATAPDINGTLKGVTGVSLLKEVKEAEFEYEVCFKCHADNNFSSTTIKRKIHVLNTRFDFDLNNPSYHPVAGPGKGTDVPSLRTELVPPYTTSSIIYCTDCHGSDQSVKAGGTGANGPHGSGVKYMLLHAYETDRYPLLPYADSQYALCFRCHDQTRLFNATSPFRKVSTGTPLHDLHVRQQGVSCYICHDPHGIRGGTDKGNAHLINFVDTTFIGAASYDSDDTTDGTPKSCTVSCHSANPRTYGNGS